MSLVYSLYVWFTMYMPADNGRQQYIIMYTFTLERLIQMWSDGLIDDEQLDYYSVRILVPYVR